MRKPTREELADAQNRTLRDIIAPDLRVLFCGINPGLWSGATGHHFARPGNRFWPALYSGGFTPRLFSPDEKEKLLDLGIGITNFVRRTTAAAAELDDEEIRAGATQLRARVRRYAPRVLAILGVGAYRTGFARPKAGLGLQEETIASTRIWVLPSPSGLNAHFQPRDFARLFRELREFSDSSSERRNS